MTEFGKAKQEPFKALSISTVGETGIVITQATGYGKPGEEIVNSSTTVWAGDSATKAGKFVTEWLNGCRSPQTEEKPKS